VVNISCLGSYLCIDGTYQRPDILRPVSMIRRPVPALTVDLSRDWRDPNRGESHTLDVVKLRDEAAPGTSAVGLPRRVALCRGREVCPREPVHHYLVNRLLSPLPRRKSLDSYAPEGHGECHSYQQEEPGPPVNIAHCRRQAEDALPDEFLLQPQENTVGFHCSI